MIIIVFSVETHARERERRRISRRQRHRHESDGFVGKKDTRERTSPNKKMITSKCYVNRESRIVCRTKDKEDWRQNLNEAIEEKKMLTKKANIVERIIRKLKEEKVNDKFYRNNEPKRTPCKCLPENSFKKDLEEQRMRYKEGTLNLIRRNSE